MAELTKTKNKFELARDASYQAILASAMKAFYEKGYVGARLNDLVEGSGYTTGAFYFHFASKAECLYAIEDYRRQLRGSWETVLESFSADASVEEIVRKVYEGFDRSLSSMHAWTVVLSEFFNQQGQDEGVKEKLAEIYRSWLEELSSFVRLLQARGYVDRSKDAELLSMEVLAFAEGLTTHGRIFGIEPSACNRAVVDGTVKLLSA